MKSWPARLLVHNCGGALVQKQKYLSKVPGVHIHLERRAIGIDSMHRNRTKSFSTRMH